MGYQSEGDEECDALVAAGKAGRHRTGACHSMPLAWIIPVCCSFVVGIAAERWRQHSQSGATTSFDSAKNAPQAEQQQRRWSADSTFDWLAAATFGEDKHAATWRALGTNKSVWEPSETPESAKQRYPHIVLALIDDQGYSDMGYTNGGFDQLQNATPFLDALAADGIKLAKYYSQQLCTPARAALLSGYYPIHTGMQHDVIQPESVWGMPTDYMLLPSFLKKVGKYETFAIGKWHLGHYKSEYLPYNRGFDEFYGYLSDQLWYYSHKSPHACAHSTCFYDMRHNGVHAVDSIGVYSTFLLSDQFDSIINRTSRTADPTFVYLSWQNVHAPLDPPPRKYFTAADIALLDSVEDPYRRTFAAITIILDNAMRAAVGTLQSYGLYDNVVLVVASDNGGCSSSGGYNHPLRGGKQYLYEGGIHVNAFVHSPLIPLARRGGYYEGLFHVSDWVPTIVTGALNTRPELLPADLDGIDQWNALLRANDEEMRDYPRTEILHNIDIWSLAHVGANLSLLSTPIQAIRVGDMKLVMGQDASSYFEPVFSTCPEGLGYCSPSYENIEDCAYGYDNVTYLFNITHDPSEAKNLASLRPDIVQHLLERLQTFRDSMVDSVYAPCDYIAAYTAWTERGYFVGPFERS